MRKIFTLFIISFTLNAAANKISDAYEALSIFDYFKAKQLFYKSQAKFPCESSFGLASIYYRSDNPFSNIDSAAKYISISQTQFKDTVTYSLFHINLESIQILANKISTKGFEIHCNNNSIKDLNHFLSHFYFSNEALLAKVFFARDAILLENFTKHQSSDSITEFLLKHPESVLYKQGQQTFYDFQYKEKTPNKTLQELQVFIKKYPSNPNISDAETTLFNLTQQLHSADSVYQFIKKYSSSLTLEASWKLLYSLSVNNYSKDELTAFLNKYPDYPYNEIVLKEIAMSQNILIPLKNTNDKYGFIDTLGNWVIKPKYDDALNFSEGFASVCKNDSCFYINKEGSKTSDYVYEETENYKDGIAIVKKDNVYYLINRSGQFISKGYQDINESFSKLYVCKQNNLYGAINLKGEIIIPFSYNKLGNFKNRFAYYLSSQYGLVDINNRTLEAQWEWISDVDSNSIAIVKKKNQFGLMNVNEQIILPCEYDYLTHCKDDIYLVVKNNLYGFFNSKEKCFITSIEYNYNSSFETSYYTNGIFFKLIKDNEVALVDANGRYSINFGTYTNLFFAKCDIIRIQKNNKYGFVDRKLKPVTSLEFEKATDFENNKSIVSKAKTSSLIDKSGKVIYSIKNAAIESADYNLYFVKQNDLIGLLDDQGKMLLNIEFDSMDLISNQLYICIKDNEMYLFNLKTKLLKKI
jgi:hypothetical protein